MHPASLEAVVESADLASFLRNWIAHYYPKGSLQSLATKCRLSSKGTLHDLISGRRRPSMEILQALAHGLKIAGPERKLFFKLWEVSGGKKTEKSDEHLESLREKVRQKKSKQISSKLPTFKGWDHLFSALGGLEEGSQIKDLSNQTGITSERCSKILHELCALDLVKFDPARNTYHANAVHSIFEKNSAEERAYLLGKLSEIKSSLSKNFGNKDAAIYRSFVFSVASEKFPILREKIRTLLDDFADDAESSSGTAIAEMFLSFEVTSDFSE